MSDIKITPIVVRGKVNYCKFLGEPRLNYDKTGNEWTSDFYDFDVKALQTSFKNADYDKKPRQKDGYLDGKPYYTLKQKAERANGKPNDPVKVVDKDGNPWPEDVEIGNGSTVDVRMEVWDFGPRKFKGLYPKAMRVLELVEFKRDLFDPLSVDEVEKFSSGKSASDFASEAGNVWDDGDKKPWVSDDDLDDDF